jgi:hypothetical protein
LKSTDLSDVVVSNVFDIGRRVSAEVDYDLLRSAARRGVRAAGLGKPEELSARDGARIVVGQGARNEARCDRVMDAWRQDVKGRAPMQ